MGGGGEWGRQVPRPSPFLHEGPRTGGHGNLVRSEAGRVGGKGVRSAAARAPCATCRPHPSCDRGGLSVDINRLTD